VSCAAPKCIWNLWLLNTLNAHTLTRLECQTSGKPSTRLPLERLVEQEPDLIYVV
jgi:hypothetical protein